MSNLSEEEIILDLKRIIDTDNCWLEDEESADEDMIEWAKLEKSAIQGLLDLYQKEKEKNNNILGLVFEYGQIDGEHHKTWVIDQIVRILTENDYDKWVKHYEYDEETGEDYTWDIGIAP